ncbi:HAD family hydrolase [Pedobacter jamesrossensis]|uniref:phosphoglycolate phosphatase n=1 Tax=Pedobacter jamesrossensis TaxID=1908238 RepID=A0ABV8NN58_9SPHI
MKNIYLDNIKLVIFDVDGTLYDQSKLRKKMLVELIRYYILRPWKFKDLLIVYHFRKEREKKAGQQIDNLQEEQYNWCATKINLPVSRIKEVVNKWIFNFPIKYLKESTYPGVNSFFSKLEQNGILTAIYSDYDSKLKLESMNLAAALLVSSTDENINAMKPLPNGLNYILSKLNIVDKNKCLFIGDRQELDGLCAEQAGIPFLLVDKEQAKDNFYKSLSNKLA